MNQNQLSTMFNNSKSLTPVSTQFTTQTALVGQMSPEQIDREQDIKVLGIVACSCVAIGIAGLLCFALKDD